MSTPARRGDDLSASLFLRRGGLGRVGLDRIALIEAIGALGSISAAAKQVGLSYKGAWDAVQALNNLFDGPLVEAELNGLMARLDGRDSLAAGGDLGVFWRLGMRTSARNALRGTVTAVTDGAVNTEVTLGLGGGVEIVSVVTRRSVEDLGLEPGRPATALIKSSFVLLAVGEGLRTSARNQIAGIVAEREDGAVSSEVTLDIGAGKTLTATITRESAEALDLKVGDKATALIKAPHVILAVE